MIYTLTLNPALDLELITPEVRFDEVLRATSQRVDYGGKGFNVSRVLNALGTPSLAMGFVGGHVGDTLQSGLAELGIRTDFVRTSGETRTNISIVPEDRGHYLKINEAGPIVSVEEQAELIAKVRQYVRARDWWVMAGSLPPGVPEDFYACVIKIVQENGARALLDANGDALTLGCQAGVFLAKPNRVEAEKLVGFEIHTREDAVRAAEAIHEMGVQVVVISLGRDGAVALEGEHIWAAVPPQISQRNPIGAGDALVAGLVWGYGRRDELKTSLTWGIACGSAAASQEGTGVGPRDLVSQMVKQVVVEKVS